MDDGTFPLSRDLDLWMPTLTFFLGVATGAGLLLTYLGWVL